MRPSQKNPTEQENFNPIQNSYTSLRNEYREVDTAIHVLNVIRRILGYYFIQLCGYNGVNLRKRVLEDNKDKLVESVENGQYDYTKYHLASSMLSYISTNTVGISDCYDYVDDCLDINIYRKVFKLIFEVLD